MCVKTTTIKYSSIPETLDNVNYLALVGTAILTRGKHFRWEEIKFVFYNGGT